MLRLFKKKPLSRKEMTEKFLEKKGVKINYNLPHVESENDIQLRTPKEIAERLVVLAAINLVAFSSVTSEEITEYLKKYNLWECVTSEEKDFLLNPTDERKNKESWKCECIWTLMWALKIVQDLSYPETMCDLSKIPSDKYPIGGGKDPNIFIKNIHETRSKSDILDACDLYYRLDWTCVDARLNGYKLNNIQPGVIYERHYALNWLIHYMDQDWDDVTCDT